MDIARFEAELSSEGYETIETKQLAAGIHNPEHVHPFDVRALVIEGEIGLSVAGATRTYGKGAVFTVAAGCRHAEQIGAEGVSYVIGRRKV